MTGPRQPYAEHWAPLFGISVAYAVEFRERAGIVRYRTRQAFLVLPDARCNAGRVVTSI